MIPEPAPAPVSPRDRLTAAQIRETLADADEYAAWMAEIVARPDDRWEPK